MKKMYDRETNPAVLIRVMPVYRKQTLPVAVFVKYMDTSAGARFWQQYSKEYQYPKCARKAAKMLEWSHYAWKEEAPENV